jgi:hypothetical protein
MFKLKLINYHKIITVLLIILTASCGQNNQSEVLLDPSEMDKSWETGQPCVAPCWHGLIPGLSPANIVLEKTQNLTFIDAQRISENQYERWNGKTMELITTLDLPCKNPPNLSCAYIQIKKNIVSEIIIWPNYSVTFQEFVKNYGNPDAFSLSRMDVEAKGCTVSLFWESRMTGISYKEERYPLLFGEDICDKIKKTGNKIPPELPIQWIIYRQDSVMDELMRDPGLINWVGFDDDN